jgi:hypothetical protein
VRRRSAPPPTEASLSWPESPSTRTRRGRTPCSGTAHRRLRTAHSYRCGSHRFNRSRHHRTEAHAARTGPAVPRVGRRNPREGRVSFCGFHELRTRLSALQLQIQTLLRPPRRSPHAVLSPEQVKAKLEMVYRQIERLTRIIGQLTDASRITAGRLRLELEEIDFLPSSVVLSVAFARKPAKHLRTSRSAR